MLSVEQVVQGAAHGHAIVALDQKRSPAQQASGKVAEVEEPRPAERHRRHPVAIAPKGSRVRILRCRANERDQVDLVALGQVAQDVIGFDLRTAIRRIRYHLSKQQDAHIPSVLPVEECS